MNPILTKLSELALEPVSMPAFVVWILLFCILIGAWGFARLAGKNEMVRSLRALNESTSARVTLMRNERNEAQEALWEFIKMETADASAREEKLLGMLTAQRCEKHPVIDYAKICREAVEKWRAGQAGKDGTRSEPGVEKKS